MTNLFIQLITSLAKRRISLLVFYVIIFDLIVTIIFSYVLFPNHSAGPQFDSRLEAFLMAVIVAPILETYLIQYSIIGFIVKRYPSKLLEACLISATIFGLLHYYSIEYMAKTFISGVVYGILFLVSIEKKIYPLLPVAISHSIYNFLGFLTQYAL